MLCYIMLCYIIYRALELLMALQAVMPPGVITYNMTVTSCEKRRQWRHVLGLLETMRDHRVVPDVITYSAAISACEKCRQLAPMFRR